MFVRPSLQVIKRWASEINDAATSRHPMVQYHAVALLHATRAGDRQAVTKMVTQLVRTGTKSPLAQALLVKYVAQVIADSTPESRPFYDFLESCLRHKAEVVIFEAARAIVNLRDVALRELQPAITVLQLFLSSSKPVMRRVKFFVVMMIESGRSFFSYNHSRAFFCDILLKG